MSTSARDETDPFHNTVPEKKTGCDETSAKLS